MTRDELQVRLDAYFEGTLDSAETSSLRAELHGHPDLEAEFLLWEELGEVSVEEPGPGLSLRLAEMLEEAKREERAAAPEKGQTWMEHALTRFWPAQPAYSFAAAALCLVLGLAGGWLAGSGRTGAGGDDAILRDLRAEVKDTRELAILTMLQQQSAADRLRGVSYTSGMREPNAAVLGALIRTLRYDTSVDVRLASIGALSRYRDQTMVRTAFVDALQDSSSPMVQVELIEQLATIDDVQVRQALEEMSVNEKADPNVRLAAAKKVQATL